MAVIEVISGCKFNVVIFVIALASSHPRRRRAEAKPLSAISEKRVYIF
jgi:hypothetical protein